MYRDEGSIPFTRSKRRPAKFVPPKPPVKAVSSHSPLFFPPNVSAAAGPRLTSKSSPEEEVRCFLSLIRGREDVHAVRWEGRNGKAGYFPACRIAWGKPSPKFSEAPQEYFPLTDQVIHDHLMGKVTAGVYPLLVG